MVSLEDAVHHVLAFVLNSKIADQLLWRDELWVFHREVGLALRELLVSSGVGDQVLTWRLDGEGSGLDEVVLTTDTGCCSVPLLLVRQRSQSLAFVLRQYWRLSNVKDPQALVVCPNLQFATTLVQVCVIPQILSFLFLYLVACRLDLHRTTAK